MNVELRRARHRQMFIFLLVCAGMLGLLARLYYWQVLQSSHLSQLANAEHIQNQILNAPRGLIYDAQGHILATNIVRDDVYIEPIQFVQDHPDAENRQAQLALLVQRLHQVLPGVSEDSLNQAFASNQATVRIASLIEPTQSQRLRSLRLSYTFLEPHTARNYPNGELAAQVLGFVQDGGNGVYGVEGMYNKLLAGKSGNFTAETDLSGNPLTVGASSQQAAVNGADLTLTIDSSLQYIAQTMLANEVKRLEAQSGSVIVLNARTGGIVAMAGAPTFDPNHYSQYYKDRGCLGSRFVYFNPSLTCAYEPGSTMKAVTMAAALDQSLITPHTTLHDPGYITFKDGTPTVTNWRTKSYGIETMTQVLEHSANVGAAYVAHDILGPDRFYPYLQRFGFGQAYNIDGPEEKGGYRTNKSPDWSPSDLARQSFGQAILATPLQMAMVFQAIANGGVMMQPYLVASVENNGQVETTQPHALRRVISEQAAKLLSGMLVSAANYNQQATFQGYSVAVKTGTATTQGISDDETEASMAGFLPATNPQFVILVKLDRPHANDNIYGGTAAAPLWKAVAQQLMWHYGVPPDQPQA
ncbi:penicillin-binding protein 2 [Ktedonosporobacter rubrisoli]|uniref:Penicillin-binding protein 2 n=1 Tax=Ktedonosporobacter rubrisoli TaxID=2509675 RepID=A0A4P6JZJ8_KTERU|nr:penicillin-binding protein 2 [Ktedonosporobacter rubrisoli]QBD81189.1 penicillin-binding protein 2 [Ktedonosporobacter rubrisoli]